jgi:subtilisin family serine protease
MRSPGSLAGRFLQSAAVVVVLIALGFIGNGLGVPIDHATITEVINDVTVRDPKSTQVTPAEVNGLFRNPQIMRTGDNSGSEMVAQDKTIIRLGAHTLYSFEPKERIINLSEGSLLFQSPHGMGGGTIRTASATASVLGTTIIVAATSDGGFKLLVLEGTGEVRMRNGQSRTLHAGQMVFIAPGAREPGPVIDFLLGDEVNTARLVQGFKRRLPTWNKILKEILKQDQQIALGNFQAPAVVLGNIPDPNFRINAANATQSHVVPTPVPTPHPTPMMMMMKVPSTVMNKGGT